MKPIRTSLKRVVLWSISVPLSLYALYVAAVFVFLSTPLFEKVVYLGVRAGEIGIGRGWSWIPGRLELRSVLLEIQDKNMNLQVRIPQAEVTLSLKALTRKRVEISRLVTSALASEGIDTQIYLRTPEEKIQYIQGKEAMQRERGQDPFAPPDPDGWKVSIHGIMLQRINRIQIGKWAFLGNAAILNGAFDLAPGVRARIFPTRIVIHEGKIPHVADKLSGKVEAEFKEFDVQEIAGDDIYRYMSTTLALDGELQQGGFLNPLFSSTPSVRFEQLAGTFSSKVEVVSGLLQLGSYLSITSQKIALRAVRLNATGPGELRWKVILDKNKPVSRLSLRLSPLHITLLSSQGESPRKSRKSEAHIEIDSPDTDLIEPFRRLSGRLKLNIPFDRTWTNAARFLPVISNLENGRMLVRATLSSDARKPDVLVVESARIQGREFRFNFGKDASEGSKEPWGFSVNIRRTVLNTSEEAPSANGRFSARIQSTRPVAEWLKKEEIISSLVYSMALQAPVLVSGTVRAKKGEFRIQPVHARLGDSITAEGALRWGQEGFATRLLTRSGIVSVGVKVQNEKLDTSLMAGEGWLERELATIPSAAIP